MRTGLMAHLMAPALLALLRWRLGFGAARLWRLLPFAARASSSWLRLRAPPSPVPVPIGSGAGGAVPAPWHSSEALHGTGGGGTGSRRHAGVVDLGQGAVLVLRDEGVAGEEVGVGAVGADSQQARVEGAEPVEISCGRRRPSTRRRPGDYRDPVELSSRWS